MKKLFSIGLLLISMATFAQEKYEYAILESQVSGLGRYLFLTTESNVIDYDLPKKGSVIPSLLLKARELQNEGWEVHNTTSTLQGQFDNIRYYLRRKKQ